MEKELNKLNQLRSKRLAKEAVVTSLRKRIEAHNRKVTQTRRDMAVALIQHVVTNKLLG